MDKIGNLPDAQDAGENKIKGRLEISRMRIVFEWDAEGNVSSVAAARVRMPDLDRPDLAALESDITLEADRAPKAITDLAPTLVEAFKRKILKDLR